MSDFTTYIELLRIIEEGKSPNCFDTEIQGSVRMQKASRSFLRVEYHLPLTIFVGFESSLQFYRTGSTSCLFRLVAPSRVHAAAAKVCGETSRDGLSSVDRHALTFLVYILPSCNTAG